MSFKGASVLCGINGTKKTAKRLHIGGGIVEEVVTSTCNDCGDLSAALEWTSWAPCADETSGRVVEGMLCRRRGNTYMGFEEEGRCQRHLTNTRFYFSFVQRLFVRLHGHNSQQAATGDQWVQKPLVLGSFEKSL